MSPEHELVFLKSGFNNIARQWANTRDGTYLRADVPDYGDYKLTLDFLFQQAISQGVDKLTTFASDNKVSVPLRRDAVEFLVEAGLASPQADPTVQLATLKGLQRLHHSQELVPFGPNVPGLIATVPIMGTSSTSEILRRTRDSLVAQLQGTAEPRYAHGVRAGATYYPRPAQA